MEAPLCAGAKKELLAQGGRAGKLLVRVVCVAPVAHGGRVDLAAAGANARLATEDSSSVAFISTPNAAVVGASGPILESVGIARLSPRSGSAGMAKLLAAIRHAGGASSVREAVNRTLAEG